MDGRFSSTPTSRAEARRGSAPPGVPGGDEIILLVEDQAQVRDTARAVLERLGYDVRTAESADEALRYVRAGAELDLLFTDVVLPGMNGLALAERVAAERAGLRVLFTSGYTSAASVPGCTLNGAPCAFLQKPFNVDLLASAVRELLDRPG